MLSVQTSSKLQDAFDKTQRLTGKDFFYRLRVTESDVGIIETVLQFAYTGNIVLPHGAPLDIMRVLTCSQELGFDANKVAGCLAAMLALTDDRLAVLHYSILLSVSSVLLNYYCFVDAEKTITMKVVYI